MPDYSFERCDGHHEKVDLKLRKNGPASVRGFRSCNRPFYQSQREAVTALQEKELGFGATTEKRCPELVVPARGS